MLLYGASMVYGFACTTGFSELAQVLGQGEVATGLIVGIVFVAAGLAFKVSAVPFHMWTPDVYEGSPTPITRVLRRGAQDRRPWLWSFASQFRHFPASTISGARSSSSSP